MISTLGVHFVYSRTRALATLHNSYVVGSQCVPGASRDKLKAKEIEYVNWLAGQVHSKGMAVGMKNSIEIIPNVVSKMDFAINERMSLVCVSKIARAFIFFLQLNDSYCLQSVSCLSTCAQATTASCASLPTSLLRHATFL